MSMAKREFPIHMVVREGHVGGLGCALILSRACVVGRSYVCTT